MRPTSPIESLDFSDAFLDRPAKWQDRKHRLPRRLTDPTSSRAQIVRSTSTLGGAAVISMIMALLRSKVVALTLGPAGVGLIGLLTNFMGTAANLASVGIGMAGIRHVAEATASGDAHSVARARQSMTFGMGMLALIGGFIVWAARHPLAELVLGDDSKAGMIGAAACGVALLVAATSQGALLNGLGRSRDLAITTAVSAIVSTLIGVFLLLTIREDAIVPLVLLLPASSFLVGHFLVSRLKLPRVRLSIAESTRDCAGLAKLGMSFLTSLMIQSLAYMALRTRLQGTLGLESLGHFEAAWTISMAYLGAILTAMGTDFYPRLTVLIDQPKSATALVNEQTSVALWLCAPICVGMIGFSPLVTNLLFSSAFSESSTLLRMFVLGDVLKVLSWPLQFVLLAAGAGRRFIALHLLTNLVLVGTPFMLLGRFGLTSVGLGYIGLFLLYLPLVYFWAHKRIGFHWDREVIRGAAILICSALITFAAVSWSATAGMVVGGLLSVALGLSSLQHLLKLAPSSSPIGRMTARLAASPFLRPFVDRAR